MLSLRLRTLGTPSFGEQRDPECVRVCVLKGGRLNSYTEEEAPPFPLSNDSRACVTMAASWSFPCSWCTCSRFLCIAHMTALYLLPLPPFSSHAPSVRPSIRLHPSSLLISALNQPFIYFFYFFQISIHQHVTARVCHVLIERRMGERDRRRRGEIKRGRVRERNAQTGMHIA